MEQNTEDILDKPSPRNSCICVTTPRKIYILILLIAIFNFAVLGSLVAAHLYQRNELREVRIASAKAVAECRRYVALMQVNHKLQQDRKNNMSNERNIFGKSPTIIKRSEDPKNVSPRQANSNLLTRCPFNSQKRRKLCSFIVKEVSRHAKLNLTELRKEIKDVIKDSFLKAYVNLLAKNYDDELMNQHIREKGMFILRWDNTVLRKCQRQPKILEQCRVTRNSGIGLDYSDVQNGSIKAVKVEVQGIYFVYCQLTFTINKAKDSKNVAHMISKATILMRERNHGTEYIELISQTPVLTGQGNERLITVSMFTQAYLYKNSKVMVTISLRSRAARPSDRMEVELYNSNGRSQTFNVFGMYLLKKTEDGP